MPTNSLTSNQHLTTLFVLLFVLALFPGLPQYLLAIPFRFLFSSKTPVSSLPIITCPIGCAPTPPTATTPATMAWFQKTITLPSKSRGSYLITEDVVKALPELKDYKVGLLNLFVQHTSCALSLNENWDSDVREDMSDALDRIAPEDRKGNLYRHSAEGLDDMPVSLMGGWSMRCFLLIRGRHILSRRLLGRVLLCRSRMGSLIRGRGREFGE